MVTYFKAVLYIEQQILTTVMACIIANKSTDHAKPHSICFLPQYQR